MFVGNALRSVPNSPENTPNHRRFPGVDRACVSGRL